MSGQPWWKSAVIYHIYPRSFLDTNRDGFGDLPGITARLQYLRELGADAIWMGPVFPSPQVDNGYDISDYRAVDPLFGSLQDMDILIAEAHRLGIRVLLDLVFNHTSDQHPWFAASRDNPDGPCGDWYIWRDAVVGAAGDAGGAGDAGVADGGRPNNWESFFSVPAWTWSPERNQYYLHLFAPEQPDLNWENPAVRRELAAIANFWLDRGVDGFRMDVINVISKCPGLPSIPEGSSPQGFFIDGPRVTEWLLEFRGSLRADREILLVGETPGISPEAARRYTTTALDMVLLFDHLAVDHGPGGRWDPRPLRIEALRRIVATWQRELEEPSWPSIYLSNHDQPRVVSRYGNDGEYRFESATALATAFYLQRGTPIVYQGDEIGMANFPLTAPEQILDIESRNAYTRLVEEAGLTPEEAFERVRREARDNGRTPMQWSAEGRAGFTDVLPWFPVNPDFPRWNVAEQDSASGSVLGYFRELFALRRRERVLQEGLFHMRGCDADSPLFVFDRELSGESTITVAANLSDRHVPVASLARAGDAPGGENVLLCNYDTTAADAGRWDAGRWILRPWEAVVFFSSLR